MLRVAEKNSATYSFHSGRYFSSVASTKFTVSSDAMLTVASD